MKSNRSGNLLYILAIASSVALLILYGAGYLRFLFTENRSAQVSQLSRMMQQVNALRIYVNGIEYELNVYLTTHNPESVKNINRLKGEALAEIDSLKKMCNPSLVPCDSGIVQIDSLFRGSEKKVDALIQLASASRKHTAAFLELDTQYDFYRLGIAAAFTRIVKQGNEKLRKDHASFNTETRDKYILLGMVSVITTLLLVFISWRYRQHLLQNERELQVRKDFEDSREGILILNADKCIVYANSPAQLLLDAKEKKILDQSIFDAMQDEAGRHDADLSTKLNTGFATRELTEFDFYQSRAARWIKVNLVPYADAFTLYLKDITAIKLAEEELRKSKRLYAFISRCNNLVLHEKNAVKLYEGLCGMAVSEGGFLFTWVGIPQPESGLMLPTYKAGAEQGYLAKISVSILDTPRGNGPMGRAYRTGEYYYCNDIRMDEAMAPWAEQALERGFRSSISLPLKVNGKVISVWTLYADRTHFFTAEEQQLLVQVSENIGYALTNLQMENERRAIETKLLVVNEAIRQSSASVVITDIQGKIDYVNPAFLKLTGYSLEEVLGQNPNVLKTGHTTKEQYEKLWDDITHARAWQGEFLNKKKNGETYWEHAIISPISNEKGEITHFVAVKENITDRKYLEEIQQQLLTIIENTQAYIAMGDLEERMSYFNSAFRKALELGDDPPSKYHAADFRVHDDQKMRPEVREALMTTGKWMGENEYRSRSGKIIPVWQVIVLHKNISGEPTYYSTTAIDITRSKEAEKDMKRLNEELRELSSHLQSVREIEKNKIMNEVHDELGQGLAALMFDVNWIKNHLNDDKAIVEKKVDALIQSIAERLNSFLKIYSSANPSLLQELGLFGAVQSLVTAFLRSENAQVHFESNAESESFDPAISLAIYRVVQEALRNIQLYAAARRVTLVLNKEADKVNLLIEDDGCGFDLVKVNTRYHYGILEMRERVYALNGIFEISSEIGKGTVIRAEVPLQLPAEK